MSSQAIPRAGARDHITVGLTVGGVVAWLGAVLPAALTSARYPVPWVWWPLVLLQLACFVIISVRRAHLSRAQGAALVAVMVVAGVAAVSLWGADHTAPVMLVLCAGTAGWAIGTRGSALVAVGICIVLTAILLREDSVVWALIYCALIWFAWLMVTVVIREERARQLAADTATALAEANAQLSRANAELSAAQAALSEVSKADERLRISRDLHDGMGQQLTALSLHLNLIGHLVEPGTQSSEHVAQARALVSEVIRDMRGIVTALRDGHTSARDEIARMARVMPRPQTLLDLDPGLDEAPVGVTATLVRVVQEALTNVARHSSAEHAWVTVWRRPGSVDFEVRDDGPVLHGVVPGNGLSGMTERVRALGGELTWEAPPEGGLRLRGTLPVGPS